MKCSYLFAKRIFGCCFELADFATTRVVRLVGVPESSRYLFLEVESGKGYCLTCFTGVDFEFLVFGKKSCFPDGF
jgi:hypothetical protein